MHNLRTGILCAATLIAAPSAIAQTQADFQKACPKICAESSRAFEAKNIKWFQANSTPNFTYVDYNGKSEKKKEALAGLQQMFSMAKSIDVAVKCGKMTYVGKGVGKHQNVMTSTIQMVGPDKKMHKMVVKVRSEDHMKFVNGKWMMTKIVELGAPTMMMDGKPYDPSKGGG